MTDRGRIAITVASALLLGAYTYGCAFDISPPGVIDDLWPGVAGAVVYGLANLGVFLVYRWWALLPALAPMAVTHRASRLAFQLNLMRRAVL